MKEIELFVDCGGIAFARHQVASDLVRLAIGDSWRIAWSHQFLDDLSRSLNENDLAIARCKIGGACWSQHLADVDRIIRGISDHRLQASKQNDSDLFVDC
jgi:hypothetical protein